MIDDPLTPETPPSVDTNASPVEEDVIVCETPEGTPVIAPPADPVDAESGWHVPPGATPTADTTSARLVVKRSGAETDVVFPVTGNATIGRFDPALGPIDIDLASLPEGSYVSRKHARLELRDGSWYLIDQGSSNGTFLLRDDFERITEAEIKDGDEFALGNARFVFHNC